MGCAALGDGMGPVGPGFVAIGQGGAGQHHPVSRLEHHPGEGLHRIEPVAVEPDVEFAGIVAVDL